MKNNKKVLIIGLDGASPEIIQQAIQGEKMKFLKEILEENRNNIIKLKSTIPSSTAPAWTSMMTGVNPGKHGIYDFLIHEGLRTRPAQYSDVKSPFIWDILSKHGLKSIVIGHPLTYPVKNDENIIMVSGLLAPTLNEKSVYPMDILNILKSENYTIDIEEKMPTLKSDPKKALEVCNQSTINRLRATKRILEGYDWNFGFVLFPESDRLLHYHIGKEDIVLEYFKTVDKVIRDLSLIDDNLVVFIASDHGFVKIRKVFTVNAFLHSLGLCNIKSTTGRNFILKLGKKVVTSKAFSALLKQLRLNFGSVAEGSILKEKSKAWFTPHAESGIRLNPNLSKIKKEKIIKELLSILNNLKDPSTGDRIVKAFRRSDVYWGGEVNRAPDIILLLRKDYIATHVIPHDLNKFLFDAKELFLKEGDHVCEYAQFGILATYGVKVNVSTCSIMDITPTILDLFGIKPYDYMDGRSLLRRGE